MTEHTPVAIVTGATGGMGQEIVRELARTHRVIAIGRNPERLAELASSAGTAAAPVETWQLDLADAAALSAQVAGLDRLDVLVHAAAIGRPTRVDGATPEDWTEHFAVNVTAPAELTRVALPLLRDAAGTIVFIGSGAGTKPVPGNVVYSASKYALRGLADALRIEEEPHRIRVVTVAPGQTDTEMLRSSVPAEQYDAARYIQPSSVAGVLRFVVDAPADVQITDIAVRPRQEIVRL